MQLRSRCLNQMSISIKRLLHKFPLDGPNCSTTVCSIKLNREFKALRKSRGLGWLIHQPFFHRWNNKRTEKLPKSLEYSTLKDVTRKRYQTEQKTSQSSVAHNSFSTGRCTGLEENRHLNTCLGALGAGGGEELTQFPVCSSVLQ